MTILPNLRAEDKVRAKADPNHRCWDKGNFCAICVANLAVFALNAKNDAINGYCRELDAMSRERGALGREVIILRSTIGRPV